MFVMPPNKISSYSRL